jgi:hypothetical protein
VAYPPSLRTSPARVRVATPSGLGPHLLSKFEILAVIMLQILGFCDIILHRRFEESRYLRLQGQAGLEDGRDSVLRT